MTHELHATTVNILNILNDCQLHTGTEIADALGISRTAVWKVIQRLKKYNVDIQSEHKGYSLKHPLVLFNKQIIEKTFDESNVDFEIFESVSSTNDYLKNMPSLKQRQICIAEHQSHGRGRMGRTWASPFGRNIYCSVSYLINKDISELSGLSLVVGVLVAKALRVVDKALKPHLKWPNDIYIQGKKVGGILIDILAESNGSCRVIIGIGVNVNMKSIPLEDVEEPWTSLETVLGKKLDRNDVVASLLTTLFYGINLFLEKGMNPFLPQWKAYDLLENQQIAVQNGEKVVKGTAKGINSQGHLLMELSSGQITPFSFGDARLLKNSL